MVPSNREGRSPRRNGTPVAVPASARQRNAESPPAAFSCDLRRCVPHAAFIEEVDLQDSGSSTTPYTASWDYRDPLALETFPRQLSGRHHRAPAVCIVPAGRRACRFAQGGETFRPVARRLEDEPPVVTRGAPRPASSSQAPARAGLHDGRASILAGAMPAKNRITPGTSDRREGRVHPCACRDERWEASDQRDACDLGVQRASVSERTVLLEFFSVIGKGHDDGVVQAFAVPQTHASTRPICSSV